MLRVYRSEDSGTSFDAEHEITADNDRYYGDAFVAIDVQIRKLCRNLTTIDFYPFI